MKKVERMDVKKNPDIECDSDLTFSIYILQQIDPYL